MARHRLKFVLFCTVQFVVTGCMQRTVARNGAFPAPHKINDKAPLSLSDYIRTVYKISEQNTVEAEELRRKALESNPELAQIAARVAADPKDAQSRNKLAEGYLREGLLWSAYHLFHESRTLMDGNFDAEIGLARIWDKWGDYSLARQHAAAALAISPASSDAQETMGRIHLHRNAPADALESFKAAAELTPEKPSVLANLGYAYMLTGKLTDAKATLTKALSIDSNMPEARNNLGIVLAQMGDYQGSLAEMQKVSAPEVALNNLGAVLLAQKKPAEAAQVLQQAVENNPGYQKAADNLASARSLMPPPAVVALPSFGPAPVKNAETPKAAPATPVVTPVVETPLPAPPAAVAPAAPLAAAPATATAAVPVVKKAVETAKPVEAPKSVETPKTIAPAVAAPPQAPAVTQTKPAAETTQPTSEPNKMVAPVRRIDQPAKPAAEPRKAVKVAPKAPKTQAPASAASDEKHEANPVAAVAPVQNNVPPSGGSAPAPVKAGANLLPVYAGLAALGLGVIAWISAKSLANMRAKRIARRAFMSR